MGNAQTSSDANNAEDAAAYQELRRNAVLDDKERSALLFLTSKDQPPQDIAGVVHTLTNIGERSGVQLSACPARLHLATRNFCVRLLRHRNPTCFRFFLDSLVAQLRVMSGETPSPRRRDHGRAVLVQRTCNTLALARVLLADIVSRCSTSEGDPLLLSALLPEQDFQQLVLGLLRFSESYGDQVNSDETSVEQQMDYDVHLNVVNLLLVIASTRLFSSESDARSHPFRETLLLLTKTKEGIVQRFMMTLLKYFRKRELVPLGSSYRNAMKELHNGTAPRFATMTSPPMPSGYRLLDDVARSYRAMTEEETFQLPVFKDVINGIVDGFYQAATFINPVTKALLISTAAVGNDLVGKDLYSQCPLADRAMILLVALIHEYHEGVTGENTNEENEEDGESKENKESKENEERKWLLGIFRRSIATMVDIDEVEERRIYGTSTVLEEGGQQSVNDVSISFAALFDSIVHSLQSSFWVIDDVVVPDVSSSSSASSSASGTTTTTSSSSSMGEATEEKKEKFRKERHKRVKVESAVFLYTLMTTSVPFREYVLARNDLESIVLFLLRAVHNHHGPSSLSSSHMYVVMTLLLMFSQDSSFSKGAFQRMNAEEERGRSSESSTTTSSRGSSSGVDLLGGLEWLHGDSSELSRGTLSLGDVEMQVLMRCMRIEATRIKFQPHSPLSTVYSGNALDEHMCDNLCAVVSNMSSHCRNVHPGVASRLIQLIQILTRRLAWVSRRAKKISGERIRAKTIRKTVNIGVAGGVAGNSTLWEELPMLHRIVSNSAGTLRPEAVFEGWDDNAKQEEEEEKKQAVGEANEEMTTDEKEALEELIHLEQQATIAGRFLKSMLELLNACLSTRALSHNVQVLYALLHSTTSSSGSHDLLASFRDKTLLDDYEYNTREEQETCGAWSVELCRLCDPLTDLVGFMRSHLDQKREEECGSGGGWVDVATVMTVLKSGIRKFLTLRAEQRSKQLQQEQQQERHEQQEEAASFVYEEVEGASAFFLPYSWSLVLDGTRELVWPVTKVELFPMTPYYMEDALRLEEGEDVEDVGESALVVVDECVVGDLELDSPL